MKLDLLEIIRCPVCGNKMPDSWGEEMVIESPFELGQWVEPSASNRRHLAAPLERRTTLQS